MGAFIKGDKSTKHEGVTLWIPDAEVVEALVLSDEAKAEFEAGWRRRYKEWLAMREECLKTIVVGAGLAWPVSEKDAKRVVLKDGHSELGDWVEVVIDGKSAGLVVECMARDEPPRVARLGGE